MITPAPEITTDKKSKPQNRSPKFDQSKEYQIVGYGPPKKTKTGVTRKAIFHDSDSVKREAIRNVRALVKNNPEEFSQAEVYGPDNTLIYQCHWNAEQKRVIVEEL
jgi:hypothetical protein